MEQSPVTFQYVPPLRSALLIAAFTGWPDAGEVASATVRYLVRKLRARRFAAFDPEPFHDFTQQRPQAVVTEHDERSLAWPAGEFWAVGAELAGRDLVLFVGPEPQLRWRTYSRALLEVAARADVIHLVTLGGAYDAVPHTGAPKLSITSSDPAVVRRMEALGLEPSSYAGSASIHSAIMDAAPAQGVPTLSIWGIAPDYVQSIPNWKVCHALLQRLCEQYGLRVELDEVRAAGRALERRVERALARDPDLRAYADQVRELAGAPSQSTALSELDTESVLEEVEALLTGELPEDNDADANGG